MANTVSGPSTPIALQILLALTARLTIGNGLCITEGLYTSVMVLVPLNHWFYIAGGVLSLAIWLAFCRFRDSKLGADVGDLCFWDFIFHSAVPLIFYLAKIDPATLWYFWAGFSFLKISRVYIWQSSATQQHGWGTFGPMTRHYAKRTAPGSAPLPYRKLAVEIVAALVVAVIAAVLIKQLPDIKRVAVMWVVPITFEFLYGPIQLRNLSLFGTQVSASNLRETEKDELITRLRQENEQLKQNFFQAKQEADTLRKIHNAPKKAHTDLIEAFETTKPERQSQLVAIAQNVADVFSIKGKK